MKSPPEADPVTVGVRRSRRIPTEMALPQTVSSAAALVLSPPPDPASARGCERSFSMPDRSRAFNRERSRGRRLTGDRFAADGIAGFAVAEAMSIATPDGAFPRRRSRGTTLGVDRAHRARRRVTAEYYCLAPTRRSPSCSVVRK